MPDLIQPSTQTWAVVDLKAAEPDPRGYVARNIARLEDLAGSISERLSDLQRDLAPVLRDQGTVPGKAGSPDHPGPIQSPLAFKLDAVAERFETIALSLAAIREAVDL